MRSARQFAFLGCRLLSLYVLYRAFVKMGYVVGVVAQTFGASHPTAVISLTYNVVVGSALEILAFLIFWCGAARLSRWMVAGEIEEEDTAGFSRGNIFSIAFATAGIFLLSFTIPGLINSIFLFAIEKVPASYLVSGILALAMGIVCITGPRSLANLVVRARRW